MRMTGLMGAMAASLLVSGCAVQAEQASQLTTQSIKSPAVTSSSATTATQRLRSFCAQRHVDYQAGKAPGGAKTIEQKQADDRACESLDRQG